MYDLSKICRVCLNFDKNLIDLAHIENEPSETLMSKLEYSVSEVDWSTYEPLLCHPCIKRLNITYTFKKQCAHSANVLKNYLELVKESQKKYESPQTDGAMPPQTGTFMIVPNQKYVKILVGPQSATTSNTSANSFQNVFLNLIPTTTITPVAPQSSNNENNKETKPNMFLNLNSSFQKLVSIPSLDTFPMKTPDLAGRRVGGESVLKRNANINDMLTDSKAEEMSVEIDPTSFLSLEHDNASSEDDESQKDWDEVITKQKIVPNKHDPIKINGVSSSNGTLASEHSTNYVPIMTKDDLYSGGHFLSSSIEQSDINCESCQKSFATIRLLKQHLKQFHLGKMPFKCDYCYVEHLTRLDYESCLNKHKVEQDSANTSLTLKDFTGNSFYENDALSVSLISQMPADQDLEPNENGEYVCAVCSRIFNSSAGLLRHRVRKHNQTNRKKYFIKGMKNARCDICKREFSTQSYMQMHRKLHLRKDGGYKYKVQGRSKYKDIPDEPEDKDAASAAKRKGEDQEEKNKNIQEHEESDTDSENESDIKRMKSNAKSQDTTLINKETEGAEQDLEFSEESDSNCEENIEGNDKD